MVNANYLFFMNVFHLQDELKMVTQKMEKEREESQRKVAAKDKLLSKRALHINTLQGFSSSYFPRDNIPKVLSF